MSSAAPCAGPQGVGVITAVVPNQRWQRSAGAGLDLSYKEHVVAHRMPRMVTAFQPRDASFDQRRGGIAELVGDPCKAVGVRS